MTLVPAVKAELYSPDHDVMQDSGCVESC